MGSVLFEASFRRELSRILHSLDTELQGVCGETFYLLYAIQSQIRMMSFSGV